MAEEEEEEEAELEGERKMGEMVSESGSEVGEEDGWSFWSRVYGDAELRAEIGWGGSREPTLTERLSGERLQATRVVLWGLPTGLGEASVKAVVESALGRSGSVLKVYGGGERGWVAELYRASEASAARVALEGREVLGCRVRTGEAGPRFAPLPSLEERGLGWGEALRAKDGARSEEGLCLWRLVREELVPRLRRSGPLRLAEATALVTERGSESAQAVVRDWARGAWRGRSGVSVVGPLVVASGGSR